MGKLPVGVDLCLSILLGGLVIDDGSAIPYAPVHAVLPDNAVVRKPPSSWQRFRSVPGGRFQIVTGGRFGSISGGRLGSLGVAGFDWNMQMLLMVMLFGVGPQAVHALLSTLSGGNPAVLYAGLAPTLMTALLLIVAPAVFGVVVGVLEVKEAFGKARELMDLPRIVLNQAWDVALAAAQSNGAGFLILEIERRGNPPVLGRYGANSAVSRNGGYRDVFLEEIWQVADGSLVPSDAGGILVRGAEIQTVRFIRIPS